MKLWIITAAAALAVAGPALAHKKPDRPQVAQEQPKPQPKPHSGGTDAYGCHTDHSTGQYHCHSPR